jgi:hypothetical protein
MDGGPSRWLYLREFRPQPTKEKLQPTTTKAKKKNKGTCYDWLQGQQCKMGEKNCKYSHYCSFCNIGLPKSHVLESCSNKTVFQAAFKRPKNNKRE